VSTRIASKARGRRFVILTLDHQPAFAGPPWPLFLSFRWPSIAYALDILSWDAFFAVSMLFFAALAGVIAGDMQVRNIGVAGNVGTFPVEAILLARLF
jgi:hypothetical protein